ncbi:hypothetical protein KAR91_71035 [Candidatus Pacearchaeota archaeon]|nr:hypothetical protein [Candidatus Pacearchaeota archaeon]
MDKVNSELFIVVVSIRVWWKPWTWRRSWRKKVLKAGKDFTVDADSDIVKFRFPPAKGSYIEMTWPADCDGM